MVFTKKSSPFVETFDAAPVATQTADGAWGPTEASEAVAVRALAQLPPSQMRVALHSKPAPEHAFIDEWTRKYTGSIEFGDAYISHPTLDLHRWRNLADSEVLLARYAAVAPVNEKFHTIWKKKEFARTGRIRRQRRKKGNKPSVYPCSGRASACWTKKQSPRATALLPLSSSQSNCVPVDGFSALIRRQRIP